jgi:hypothetical protein
VIGLLLASGEAVLICINGPGCHYWLGLVAGIALSSASQPAVLPSPLLSWSRRG